MKLSSSSARNFGRWRGMSRMPKSWYSYKRKSKTTKLRKMLTMVLSFRHWSSCWNTTLLSARRSSSGSPKARKLPRDLVLVAQLKICKLYSRHMTSRWSIGTVGPFSRSTSIIWWWITSRKTVSRSLTSSLSSRPIWSRGLRSSSPRPSNLHSVAKEESSSPTKRAHSTNS